MLATIVPVIVMPGLLCQFKLATIISHSLLATIIRHSIIATIIRFAQMIPLFKEITIKYYN